MLSNSKYNQNSITIDDLVERYSAVWSDNYERQEKELLNNLYEQAKHLKQELMVFKKEVSSENIEKLINEKRREKEKERQILENRWRQCNQSFKALQEEQKKLINQQKESAFDVKNLQKKIEEFSNQIAQAKKKSTNFSSEKEPKFMTEVKENYQSPYKITLSSSNKLKKIVNQNPQKLLASTSNLFFSSKYSLNKFQPLKFTGENRTNLGTPTESSRFENSYLVSRGRSQNADQQSAERRNNLYRFLDDPRVRLKLFKIIKKQL